MAYRDPILVARGVLAATRKLDELSVRMSRAVESRITHDELRRPADHVLCWLPAHDSKCEQKIHTRPMIALMDHELATTDNTKHRMET